MPRPPEDIQPDVAELIRIGSVTSVDLAAGRCIVRYGDPDDESGGAQTPPIRWLAMAGETACWSAPSVGEQVLLLTPDGQIAASVALRGIYCNAFPAPASDQSTLLLFGDGARLRYDPESHALEAILPAGATATIEADGGITLRGDVVIEGNVTMSGTLEAEGDVLAGEISLTGHRHGGVQAGGAQSGLPV
jgi:phage baseplate assembly protein V